MKITEKQLQMMFLVLKDTLEFNDYDYSFSINQEKREHLIDEILNQQSDELIEVKE